MDRNKALEIWDAIYGKDNIWQVDCFGTWIFRDDYGDVDTTRIRPNGDGENHSYGWEIDHIRPKSSYDDEDDADFLNNYEPMHSKNNRTKADNFPHFNVGERKYRIIKCPMCSMNGFKGYGIINEQGERVDWKGRLAKYFPTNK